MQFCSVTFVLTETILRKLRTKVTHDPVARDLCDHTGGSDAKADAIAINNCRLWKWKRNDRQTVNQNVLRRFEQRFNCQSHRIVTGAENVDPVDLYRIDDTD